MSGQRYRSTDSQALDDLRLAFIESNMRFANAIIFAVAIVGLSLAGSAGASMALNTKAVTDIAKRDAHLANFRDVSQPFPGPLGMY